MLDIVYIHKYPYKCPYLDMAITPSCICIDASRALYYTPFSMDDLCHTLPFFAFIRVLSTAEI